MDRFAISPNLKLWRAVSDVPTPTDFCRSLWESIHDLDGPHNCPEEENPLKTLMSLIQLPMFLCLFNLHGYPVLFVLWYLSCFLKGLKKKTQNFSFSFTETSRS